MKNQEALFALFKKQPSVCVFRKWDYSLQRSLCLRPGCVTIHSSWSEDTLSGFAQAALTPAAFVSTWYGTGKNSSDSSTFGSGRVTTWPPSLTFLWLTEVGVCCVTAVNNIRPSLSLKPPAWRKRNHGDNQDRVWIRSSAHSSMFMLRANNIPLFFLSSSLRNNFPFLDNES